MMIFRTVGLLLATLCIALAPVAADAATLTPNGIVLVNKGNGFVRINGPTEVNSGDMIMVNEGSAQIAHAKSTAQLSPGQVYTVGNETETGAGEPGGLAGGAAGGIAGVSTTTMVVGGLVLVGVAAAVVVATQGDGGSSP